MSSEASRRTELWGSGVFSNRSELIERAARFEAAGLDGITVGDTHALRLEAWSALGALSILAPSLKLSTMSTNAVTRHPAVTAAAAATIQEISGGRFTLGVARGDSPLAFIGVGPIGLARFTRFLEIMRALLAGEGVDFARLREFTVGDLREASQLGHGHVPDDCRIQWPKDTAEEPVPLDVSASGPRTIAIAAGIADGMTLAVGANPEDIVRNVELARQARVDAGLNPDDLRVGALVNVGVHHDGDIARRLVQGTVSLTARWLSQSQPELVGVASAYDATQHGQQQPEQAKHLDRRLVDRLAVVGTPDECIERLRVLTKLGLHRIVMIPALPGPRTAESEEATRLFLTEIIPGLR